MRCDRQSECQIALIGEEIFIISHQYKDEGNYTARKTERIYAEGYHREGDIEDSTDGFYRIAVKRGQKVRMPAENKQTEADSRSEERTEDNHADRASRRSEFML